MIRKNLGTNLTSSSNMEVRPGTNGTRHCDIIRIGSHSHPSMAKAKWSHWRLQTSQPPRYFEGNTEPNHLSSETPKASPHGCPLASRILFPPWTGVYVSLGPERSQTHHRSRFSGTTEHRSCVFSTFEGISSEQRETGRDCGTFFDEIKSPQDPSIPSRAYLCCGNRFDARDSASRWVLGASAGRQGLVRLPCLPLSASAQLLCPSYLCHQPPRLTLPCFISKRDPRPP